MLPFKAVLTTTSENLYGPEHTWRMRVDDMSSLLAPEDTLLLLIR